ncbi:MAG: transcriptional regulator [Candidatus Saccharimonadales bacterium]
MIEQLFGSKTRVKLLQLFFTNPNRSFYVREITRKVDEQINSVRRELANLLSIGIITSDANNNRLYYEVNQDYEHYGALSAMFGAAQEPALDKPTKAKTKAKVSVATTSEHPLSKDLRAIGHIDLALLTGQFTRDETSGVDVLIVGDVNQAKAARFMSDLEKSEGKELRYVLIPLDNYNYRLQINDRFINQVLGSKKQVILSSVEIPVK